MRPLLCPAFTLILGGFLSCSPWIAAAPRLTPSNNSLSHEINRSIDRGAEWLIKQQDAKGFWNNADHPAVSALALVAIQGRTNETARAALKKGYEFLESCVKE